MTRRVWRWELRDEQGRDVSEASPTFTARVEAEAWLGEHWRTLPAVSAQLLCDDEPVGLVVPLREPDA